MLQNEVDNLDQYSSKALLYDLFLKYKRKDALVQAFAHQLEAFGRDQYPFTAGRERYIDPFTWWNRLARDDCANVLAVRYSQ